ncbi:hypothetical protein [Euzebya pacifica]|nr:hypothetical protein [Euzebya pacifica]
MATNLVESHPTVVDGPEAACRILADALDAIGRPVGSDRQADVVAAAVCANPAAAFEDLAKRAAAASSHATAVAAVAAALTGLANP